MFEIITWHFVRSKLKTKINGRNSTAKKLNY